VLVQGARTGATCGRAICCISAGVR
jgi:hypothetical protein